MQKPVTMRYNFHTHCKYDDGMEPLEAYVLSAIDKGIASLGFSCHQPLPFDNSWSLPKKDYAEYLAEVRRLKEEYRGQIEIYLGLETDYIPGYSDRFHEMIEDAGLDYVIGSVHLVMKPGSTDSADLLSIDGPREDFIRGIEMLYEGNTRSAVEAYYDQQREMVATQRPHVIGHLDKINMQNKGELFNEQARWYKDAVNYLLDTIAAQGTVVELNTRGVYTGKTSVYFPEREVVEKCFARGIPMMVSTDAHHPDQVDEHFDEATDLLKDVGYREVQTPFFRLSLA